MRSGSLQQPFYLRTQLPVAYGPFASERHSSLTVHQNFCAEGRKLVLTYSLLVDVLYRRALCKTGEFLWYITVYKLRPLPQAEVACIYVDGQHSKPLVEILGL